MQKQNIPREVAFVGYWFIALGVLDIINMIVSPVFFDNLKIDFLFMFIPLGLGIIQLRQSSRIWAMRIARFVYLLMPIIIIRLFAYWEKADVWILGYYPQGRAKLIAISFLAIIAVMFFWTYRILAKKEIAALFEQASVCTETTRTFTDQL